MKENTYCISLFSHAFDSHDQYTCKLYLQCRWKHVLVYNWIFHKWTCTWNVMAGILGTQFEDFQEMVASKSISLRRIKKKDLLCLSYHKNNSKKLIFLYSWMYELQLWMRSWNLPSSKAPQANNSSIKWSKLLAYEKFGFLDCSTQILKVTLHGSNSTRRYVTHFTDHIKFVFRVMMMILLIFLNVCDYDFLLSKFDLMRYFPSTPPGWLSWILQLNISGSIQIAILKIDILFIISSDDDDENVLPTEVAAVFIDNYCHFFSLAYDFSRKSIFSQKNDIMMSYVWI